MNTTASQGRDFRFGGTRDRANKAAVVRGEESDERERLVVFITPGGGDATGEVSCLNGRGDDLTENLASSVNHSSGSGRQARKGFLVVVEMRGQSHGVCASGFGEWRPGCVESKFRKSNHRLRRLTQILKGVCGFSNPPASGQACDRANSSVFVIFFVVHASEFGFVTIEPRHPIPTGLCIKAQGCAA
jgi:hypothetical protein